MLSSTVITPSAVTFSIASAISLPTLLSAAEIVAILAISLEFLTGWELDLIVSTTLSTAPLIPFLTTIGLAPAATFFIPSLIKA